jgi:hypothetical protein
MIPPYSPLCLYLSEKGKKAMAKKEILLVLIWEYPPKMKIE